MLKEIVLDVSQLEAPEPFEEIIALVRVLKKGHYIKVFHRKEPFPLFEVLLENNYHYRCDEVGQAQFFILIWHADDENVAQHCQTLELKAKQ